jgi:adenylate cyclase
VPWVPPMVVFITTSSFVFVIQSYRERGDRLLLMTLFSKHVSPEIARRIWQQRHEFLDGNRPKAQNLTATVFFSDMRGFTTVSEALGPARLIEWLNEYMEVMSAEILKRGGVINEYAGDGIMATFGIPVPRASPEEIAEDATQAIDSALAMAGALKKLNARGVAENKPPVGMRVGIFTGELVSGSLGSHERMKYTVIGDTVNTASRLESFDKEVNAPESPIPDCRILVGPLTWELVRKKFHGKELGSFRLKGREHETTITQVFSRIAS